MKRLQKGMYGNEFDNSSSNLFGLRCGQMHGAGRIGHNCGWYNSAGEKLGWGDMSVNNALTIQRELEEGEVFILLREEDSFWNFVTKNPGPTGSRCETSPDVNTPGVEYITAKCYLILTKGHAFFVDRHGYKKLGARIMPWDGLVAQVVNTEMAGRIIRTGRLPE